MTSQQARNAEFCGKVPLNQTNLIQPHGVLLIVAPDLTVLQVSENVVDVMGKPASDIAGTSLEAHLSAEEAALLRERFLQPVAGKVPLTFSFTQHGVLKKFPARVQAQPQYVIIELDREPSGAANDPFVAVYQEVEAVMAAIEATASIDEAAHLVVTELKRLSGFDKVMVYRFDEDWNGSVLAEAKEAGMDAYLGLKFPASDIPAQARDMYRKNPYRFIPDVDYKPARLYPVLNPVTGGFTDLTDSNLRSVAGVHLEYLRNMKVAASLSTRIVNDNKLWGLISCHHRTAKFLPYQMCSLFELLSTTISAKVASLEQAQVHRITSELHALYTKLVERIKASPYLAEGLQAHELLKLLSATGVAVMLKNQLHLFGATPHRRYIEDLLFWLQARNVNSLFQTTHLAGVYDGAADYAAEASGLLVLPVQPEGGDFILAFRPEAVRQVAWGGNPKEALTFEPDGKKYHPRHSFSIWKERVQQTALPWTHPELEIAEQFRTFMVAYNERKF